MLQVNYDSFKCPCLKFSITEAETCGEMRETNIDFNLNFLHISWSLEEVFIATECSWPAFDVFLNWEDCQVPSSPSFSSFSPPPSSF